MSDSIVIIPTYNEKHRENHPGRIWPAKGF